MKKTTLGIPVFCKFDKLVPAGEIEFSPFHKREHPPEQLARIGGIIKANGWRSPVIVSKRTGQLTKGKGRVLWAIGAGDSVAVQYQDYEDEQAEKRDVIADNAATLGSIDDDEGIAAMVQELGTPEAFGFTDAEVAAMVADLPPAPRVRTRVKKSQLQYKLAFDDEQQLDVWLKFLKKLQSSSPGDESVAARVVQFVTPYSQG